MWIDKYETEKMCDFILKDFMDAKNYESQAAKIVQTAEATLSDNFKNIDNVALLNQRKVLNAFINNRVSARHFAGTNGYGYDDVGRETLNCVLPMYWTPKAHW